MIKRSKENFPCSQKGKYMKKNIYCTILLLWASIWHLSAQTKLYVSPDGSDANRGTIESPLKTLEQARNQIRQLRSKGEKQSFSVFLRGGIYRFEEPFVLYSEDSGSKEYPIIYQAYPDEKVVFSGSLPLQVEWKTYNDSIWVADAKLKNEKGFTPRILFLENDRLAVWLPIVSHQNGLLDGNLRKVLIYMVCSMANGEACITS